MKFNKLKNEIFSTILESYIKNDKDKIKNIVNLIKSDKDFKDVFLFYENIETGNLPIDTDINEYIDTISKELPKKYSKVKTTAKLLKKYLNENENYVSDNNICENLDIIMNNDGSLNKLNDLVKAKNNLKQYFQENKENINEEDESLNYTKNQRMLNTVLTNNFNMLYENLLNDEDKIEIKNILNLKSDELNKKYSDLKENILNKIDNILKENIDNEINEKLLLVKEEVDKNKVSKLNYFKLKELYNGI